jgi:hypothetical protein
VVYAFALVAARHSPVPLGLAPWCFVRHPSSTRQRGSCRRRSVTRADRANNTTQYTRQYTLEAVSEARGIREGQRLCLGLRCVGLIIHERKVDVVILRLPTDTEPPGLEAGEQHSDELSKASGVEDGNSLGGAS